MNIQKAEKARQLLTEKETLEKAINYTECTFDITVKVDLPQPKKMWVESYLKRFTVDEIKVMLEQRLRKVEKQLKRL